MSDASLVVFEALLVIDVLLVSDVLLVLLISVTSPVFEIEINLLLGS